MTYSCHYEFAKSHERDSIKTMHACTLLNFKLKPSTVRIYCSDKNDTKPVAS